MAQIIVLTPEAKRELQRLIAGVINEQPDNDVLHAIYSDVVSKKFS